MDDVDDDVPSSCSTVYTVGDVSVITEDNNDDIACLDDIQDDDVDVSTDLDGSASVSESENTDQSMNCPGYVIVIDNIDMNIRRSYQRVDRTTQSYHYCHGYAVRNKVSSTPLADHPPSGSLSVDKVLPIEMDLQSILDDFKVYISRYVNVFQHLEWYVLLYAFHYRILVRHFSVFKGQKGSVKWHIPSDHVQEMSAQSVIVSFE